jgi:endonuclease/exonuclease/phosphatase family metal-dependent hydrolase
MKKIIIGMLILAVVISGCDLIDNPVAPNPAEPTEPIGNTITIANWNLQVFGQSKASNETKMQFYDDVISQYDIVFVQEIRDASETAFPLLCDRLEGYGCMASPRDGRTSSKEQIGVIFKDSIELETVETLPDPNDVWERSPIRAKFNASGYHFTAYNAHLKPDDVASEMQAFEDAISNEGNVIILGDLNYDCDYVNPDEDTSFDTWNWLIWDYEDTTVSDTDCAYDRIIVNDDMYEEIVAPGFYKEITKDFSDHYVVWVEVQV